ncbi:MAG: hypothetical protein LBV40_01805 [Methanomicrobiales archaeon]|nr:hypothetical protein [Methanomicrobiales archaeon]
MKYYIIFFVITIFSSLIGGVFGASSEAPALLEITDVESTEGTISATITIENNSRNAIKEGYLGIYLLPLVGSEISTLVGWVALPSLKIQDRITVPFTGVVPPGMVGGTYHITALVTTNSGLASPQLMNAPMQEVPVQRGESATEMTALPATDRAHVTQDVPNYQITGITIPLSGSLHPGTKITPSVSVINLGEDATEQTPVSVMLLLGNQVLYPEKATIPSIAAGKSAEVQLSYKIPDNIYLGAYSIRGLVNPYGTIPETNEGDNTFTSPGIYFIADNWIEERIEAGTCDRCGS